MNLDEEVTVFPNHSTLFGLAAFGPEHDGERDRTAGHSAVSDVENRKRIDEFYRRSQINKIGHNAEENAVIVGLDLVDLMNLRDALQSEIDNFTLLAFEATAMADSDELGDDELP